MDLKKIYTIDVACAGCKFIDSKSHCVKTLCKFHMAWNYREARENYFYWKNLKSFYKDEMPRANRLWINFRIFHLEPWLKKLFPKRFKPIRRINGNAVHYPGIKALRKPMPQIVNGQYLIF